MHALQRTDCPALVASQVRITPHCLHGNLSVWELPDMTDVRR